MNDLPDNINKFVELDQHILDHIRTEFGCQGERSVNFFKTARYLLDKTDNKLPKLGELITYCLREGMTSILWSEDNNVRQKLNKDIVDAKKRYTSIQDIPMDDKQRALNELLNHIDQLDQVRFSGNSLHEEHLIAILRKRTGTEPHEQDVKLYQGMIGKLNKALHSSISFNDTVQLWDQCIRLLTRLFLSPDVRKIKLKDLAQRDDPRESDFESLMNLIATPQHARLFFAEEISLSWLNLLITKKALDPPSDPDKTWPGFTVVKSLGEKYPIEISKWLIEMEKRFGHDLKRTQLIALAALRALEMNSPAHQVLYESVKKHPYDSIVVNFSIRGIMHFDPQDSMVKEIADIALNQNFWSGSNVLKPLFIALVEGINLKNVKKRLQLLCFKINKIDRNDHWRRIRESNPTGSITDWKYDREEDRFTELVFYLIKAISKTQSLLDLDSLLSVTDKLSGVVHSRIRSWILSNAEDVSHETLIDEISKVIGQRYPTGDDLPLLDKVINELEPEWYINYWRESLGPAPSVSEVGQSLASNNIPRSWWYTIRWLDILPVETFGMWTNSATILWSEFGRKNRNDLAKPQPVIEFKSVDSPISADQLSTIPPLEAAGTIAQWRPDPSDWTASARRLATTLESVIQNNPSEWVTNPIAIISALRHPTYIDHYLRSVLKVIQNQSLPIDNIPISEFVDVILLVFSNPWLPTSLDMSVLDDLDQNWRGAERAAGELIREFANNNAGFNHKNDEVWNALERKVKTRSDILEYSDLNDVMFIAINHNCTQALETMFSFISYEYRDTKCIRTEALELIEACLNIDYPYGPFYRAIIAPKLNFLLYINPDWVHINTGLLIGSNAPEDLGQLTIDLALEWGQPNKWLLENSIHGIKDAVKRRVERSLYHLFVAMLWELPGYSIHNTVNFLFSLEEFPKETGLTISKLVAGVDVEDDYKERAIQLWSELINKSTTNNAYKTLGSFSHMSYVEFSDPEVWAEMTLQTLSKTGEKLDLPWQVAEHLVKIPPSSTTLKIMNSLLRTSTEEKGLQYMIKKQAIMLIEQSTDLKDTDEYLQLHTAIHERREF